MKMTLCIIIFFIFVINITELYNVLFGDLSNYAFGSNLSSPYSIYVSYNSYLVFSIISVILSILTIFIYKKKIFYWLSLLLIILNMYPLLF